MKMMGGACGVRGGLWQRWWWFHRCTLISELTELSTINMYSFHVHQTSVPWFQNRSFPFAESFQVLTTFSHIHLIYFSKQLDPVAWPSHFINESPRSPRHLQARPPEGSPQAAGYL